MTDDLENLFRRYADDVRAYVATQVPACDVDDCVSEVFVHLIRTWPKVPKAHLRWLLGRAVDVTRSARAASPTPTVGSRDEARTIAAIGQAAPDVGLLEVEAALEGFSRPDREVLGLAVAGLDHVEAAHILGCTPGAYRVRLHRARERLKEALRAIPDTEGERS